MIADPPTDRRTVFLASALADAGLLWPPDDVNLEPLGVLDLLSIDNRRKEENGIDLFALHN